jgi:hypothetical protein
MTEYTAFVFMLVPTIILAFFLWRKEKSHEKEVEMLLKEIEKSRKAVLARNLAEYSASNFMEKPEDFIETPPEIEDASEVDDKLFDRMIKTQAEDLVEEVED